jgi:hypothetical protein
MKDINEIMDKHQAWLNGAESGERANLRGANLRGANGNLKEIKSLFLDTYPVTYTSEIVQIGCQRHSISEWFEFDDDTISRMDSKAINWWVSHKDLIKLSIELSPATPTKTQEKSEKAA